MTIEQWIETYKPKVYYTDVREFITHLRTLYDVYIWSVVADKDNWSVTPSKKLATAKMFIVCENMWDDADLEFCFTDEEMIKVIAYMDNLNQ